MSQSNRVREPVLAAKEHLEHQREKLRGQHVTGSPGIQVCSTWTDRLETWLADLYQHAIDDLEGQYPQVPWRTHCALVPHGGIGRREAAPYSDLDVMLLFAPEMGRHLQPLAQRLLQDISDLGPEPGFSVRTPAEACRLSLQDPVIFTSLVEARLLVGDEKLFEQFQRRFRRRVPWNARKLIAAVEKARREERVRYGDTVNLLQPNVKRSPGGLRDLHLMRWVGFARYGTTDPEILRRQGKLTAIDYRRLQAARGFLLRLRNEMHFHAGHGQDLLSRIEQVRIAEQFQYIGDDAVLPVERFMQQYFYHTGNVRDIVAHFLANARHRKTLVRLVGNLFSHRMEGDFLVGPRHIKVKRASLPKIQGDVEQVLRLMDLSNRYNKRIGARSWRAIRNEMMKREDIAVSRPTASRFMSLLSQSPRLAGLLRRLHELRVLEKVIPSFQHARCLLQFNEYHKYTVDEHCIRAVESATKFINHEGYLGDEYRRISDKSLLHLALLIHDLGKGYTEDHSEVGKRIATEVAARLFLNEEDAKTLEFLVHRHLMLAHLAFRRDTGDESVIVRAAVEIGSPSVLRLLFVMTCADLDAVGPDVLNSWKIDVLSDLVRRIRQHLTVEERADRRTQSRIHMTDHLIHLAPRDLDAEWFREQIDQVPLGYLRTTAPGEVIEDLRQLQQLTEGSVRSWGRFDPERQVTKYYVAAYEGIADGIFHRLAGALTAKGLQILSAEIHSLDQGRFLDRFFVEDPDFADAPDVSRFGEIEAALKSALRASEDDRPSFRNTWNARELGATAELSSLDTDVRTDNTASDHYTVIEVFAHDHPGLLYGIARMLHECGLSVGHARIGTYLDQVVDVFYVTDSQGNKVECPDQLKRIRQALREAVAKTRQRHEKQLDRH